MNSNELLLKLNKTLSARRVRVYWNLHKKCWSVQATKTGLVILHKDKLAIRQAKFVVRKAGQERVRKEGKKNVHAFVVGNISEHQPDLRYMQDFGSEIWYNPYEMDYFEDRDTGEEARQLYSVVLCTTNDEGRPKVYA